MSHRTEVVIRCDGCDDYQPCATGYVRLARKFLRAYGWSYVGRRDLCPKCSASGVGAETYSGDPMP